MLPMLGKHPLFKYSKLKFHPKVTKQSKHRRIFGYTFHLLNSQAINPSKFEVWWKIALNNNKWRGKRTNYSLFHSRKPSCIWIDSNSNLKSFLLGFVFMGFNQHIRFLNETTQNCKSLLKEEGPEREWFFG